MKDLYYKYPNSEYIILQDGNVARLLKPTPINNQVYYNLILDGEMKRINKRLLLKPFEDETDETVQP
jgi:hypothetical protein